MCNSIVVACGVACVHTVSVFVCLASKYSIPGSQELSFKWLGMVKKTHSKVKTQMQTQAKNIP